MLRSCFDSQLPKQTDATTTKPFNTCEKDAARYGNCLYRRFDYATNLAACSYPCRFDYYFYKMCAAGIKHPMNALYKLDLQFEKIFEDKSSEQSTFDYNEKKIKQLHDERNNRENIEDYCYLFQRDMLTCVSKQLHIDYEDYARDDPKVNTPLTPPI